MNQTQRNAHQSSTKVCRIKIFAFFNRNLEAEYYQP